MASNLNDDPVVHDAADDRIASPMSSGPDAPAPAPGSATGAVVDEPTSDHQESPAFARFRSCRWQQPAEGGSQEYCTHREVKPYAGTQGFDPDAWCLECQYYKLRRAPKKRTPLDDFGY